jgi:hypothetical protein
MQVFTASLAKAGIGVAWRSLVASEMLTDVLYRFPDFGWDWSGIGLRIVVGSTCCMIGEEVRRYWHEPNSLIPFSVTAKMASIDVSQSFLKLIGRILTTCS